GHQYRCNDKNPDHSRRKKMSFEKAQKRCSWRKGWVKRLEGATVKSLILKGKATRTMTRDWTVVKSRTETASRSMEPKPGMTKTSSMTTAPTISVVNCTPATVSTGSAALRRP